MNTQTIIALVIAVVVVGGGVWYFSSMGPQGVPNGEAGTSNNGTGTLQSLMGLTGSMKCDVATAAGPSQSSGTVYITNGKMRGDFNSTSAATGEAVIESHMIRSGGFMYTWSSAAPQGVKFSEEAIASASSQSSGQGSVDPNAQVTYSCSLWAADEAQFTPPSTVSFIDMSAMMPGGAAGTLPAGGTGYPANPYNY
ncbi:MAG: hypothetical protein ABA06_04050 [Parcubacteria bacterium C7867-001]|nr:MAG: hypothetical protein ABA06_04050 [Parcubacteria bacterium C7867-001]